MKSNLEKTIEEVNHLLEHFKQIEIQFELGRNTNTTVAHLLATKTFEYSLKKIKDIDGKKIEELKAGTADRITLIAAKQHLEPILKKYISKLDETLAKTIKTSTESHKTETSTLSGSVERSVQPEKATETSINKRVSINQEKNPEVNEDLTSAAKKSPIRTDNSMGDNQTVTSSELYKSYFSKTALEHLLIHTRTGKTAQPIKKFLTVCFIDLVGFSTLSETKDPVEVVEVLNYYFNQINSTIKKHTGDIDKFIGDAMLVTFASAENASRCAIEIVTKDLDIINSKLDYMEINDIQVHLGLNTGWIVQGDIGSLDRRETTVIGDGVNIAARIQGLTPPNELWITASTLAALGKLQRSFEPVGRKKLKGRSQETMIYRHSRKVEGDYSVLIYEPKLNVHNMILNAMHKAGIHNLRSLNSLIELEKELHAGSVKAIAVGPSINEKSLEDVVKEAEKKTHKKIPVIPIIKRKLDKNTVSLFENLGLNVFAPLYKPDGMSKVKNTVINEKVKEVARKKSEPSPQETEMLVSALNDNFDNNDNKENKENIPVKKPMSLKQAESGLRDKTVLDVLGNEIKLKFTELISQVEMKVLKTDFYNLWQYSSQKEAITFAFNFTSVAPDSISREFMTQLLKLFDFNPKPQNVKIKIDFPNEQNLDYWEALKKRFSYTFLT